jgi:hypothetical protein
MTKYRAVLAAMLLLLVVSVSLAATTASSNLGFASGHPRVIVTVNGDVVTLDGSNATLSPVKKSLVFTEGLLRSDNATVDTSKHLVRIHQANGAIYVDLVSAASISSLSARVTSMSLSTVGHPAPARDPIDTAALVAAGGS